MQTKQEFSQDPEVKVRVYRGKLGPPQAQ